MMVGEAHAGSDPPSLPPSRPAWQVKGLSWGTNAISNAVWTGVKLRDVLQAAGKGGREGGMTAACITMVAAVSDLLCWCWCGMQA